ncbi:MAG TPA: hypothetical protein VFS43_44395 [Polyangiaceae bacterium]|nr:hypothetical protein [Polyangiaceae bacterium]
MSRSTPVAAPMNTSVPSEAMGPACGVARSVHDWPSPWNACGLEPSSPATHASSLEPTQRWPETRKSIHSTLVDMMTKSPSQEVFDDPLSPAPPPAAPKPNVAPAPAPRPPLSPLAVTPAAGVARAPSDPTPSPGPVSVARAEDDDAPKVETTAEERAIFQLVREACEASPVKATIAHKDTVTHFAITLGKVTRWFLRFFCNGPRKFMTVRLTVEQVRALVPGAEVDPVSDAFTRSRVYFRSVEALAIMKPLFVAAFEQEARRKEADTAEAN